MVNQGRNGLCLTNPPSQAPSLRRPCFQPVPGCRLALPGDPIREMGDADLNHNPGRQRPRGVYSYAWMTSKLSSPNLTRSFDTEVTVGMHKNTTGRCGCGCTRTRLGDVGVGKALALANQGVQKKAKHKLLVRSYRTSAQCSLPGTIALGSNMHHVHNFALEWGPSAPCAHQTWPTQPPERCTQRWNIRSVKGLRM